MNKNFASRLFLFKLKEMPRKWGMQTHFKKESL